MVLPELRSTKDDTEREKEMIAPSPVATIYIIDKISSITKVSRPGRHIPQSEETFMFSLLASVSMYTSVS